MSDFRTNSESGGDDQTIGGQRMVPVSGVTTIPAFSLVQGNGGTPETGLSVIAPATADKNHYGATGPGQITSTIRGQATWSFPAWVKYTGSDPAVNSEVGTPGGVFTVNSNQEGYKVLQVDTGESLVWIVPFSPEAGGGGTQGNFWIEFTDEDTHKFWVTGTMSNDAKDILTILMTGGPNVSMDGAGAASGLVTLILGLDQAGDRTWELTTPDGMEFGQMYDDLGATIRPLTSIAIGDHTWSMISILVQENIPPGTNLPGAW